MSEEWNRLRRSEREQDAVVKEVCLSCLVLCGRGNDGFLVEAQI